MYNKILLENVLLVQNGNSINLKRLNRKQWLPRDCIRILLAEKSEIIKLFVKNKTKQNDGKKKKNPNPGQKKQHTDQFTTAIIMFGIIISTYSDTLILKKK